jgi:hypothetical protein
MNVMNLNLKFGGFFIPALLLSMNDCMQLAIPACLEHASTFCTYY